MGWLSKSLDKIKRKAEHAFHSVEHHIAEPVAKFAKKETHSITHFTRVAYGKAHDADRRLVESAEGFANSTLGDIQTAQKYIGNKIEDAHKIERKIFRAARRAPSKLSHIARHDFKVVEKEGRAIIHEGTEQAHKTLRTLDHIKNKLKKGVIDTEHDVVGGIEKAEHKVAGGFKHVIHETKNKIKEAEADVSKFFKKGFHIFEAGGIAVLAIAGVGGYLYLTRK